MASIPTQQLLEGNLLEMLGLRELPEPRKSELVARMTEVIQDRILDRVFDILSADLRQKVETLLDQNVSQDEINRFLKENVPEMNEIATEEILRFKAQMVHDADVVRKIAIA